MNCVVLCYCAQVLYFSVIGSIVLLMFQRRRLFSALSSIRRLPVRLSAYFHRELREMQEERIIFMCKTYVV
jgi:hypothetical protein